MSLRSLTHVDTAHVFKGEHLAATLRRTRAQCTFRYVEGYGGPQVAWTLPVTDAPVVTSAGAVPPFFAGLLPEGRRLVALRHALKTSADDDFSLLLAIGHDPIGDVRVMPDGAAVLVPPKVSPSDLSTTTFAELFERVLAPEPEDRVGLPGVQAKLSGGMVSLPLDWGEQPSILKLSPPEFPGVVEAEAWCLALASKAGLSVPSHRVLTDAAGERGLLVARFDRTPSGPHRWDALAQEDACQVLGLYPADKYRPATEEVIEALASRCGAPVVAARDLFRMVVFAYLTCNGDAHAKNFSMLRNASGEWHPSPAYDLPTTHPYGDTRMALTIDGLDREDIGRKNLLALAHAVALPTKAAERVLDAVAGAVEANLDGLSSLPFDARRVHKLGRAIGYRVKRVRGSG